MSGEDLPCAGADPCGLFVPIRCPGRTDPVLAPEKCVSLIQRILLG